MLDDITTTDDEARRITCAICRLIRVEIQSQSTDRYLHVRAAEESLTDAVTRVLKRIDNTPFLPMMIEAFREILVECCDSSESEVERYHTIARKMLEFAGVKQE